MGKGKGDGSCGAISEYMTGSLSGARSWSAERAGQQLKITLIEEDHLMEAAVALLRQQKIVAIDFETTTDTGEYGEDYGPLLGQIRLVQVGYIDSATGQGRQLIFDGQQVSLAPLKELFEDPKVRKIVHYCSFEMDWARHHLDSDISNLQDTCFAAQSINKEIRSKIARKLDPKADKACLAEITSILSKPSQDGKRILEDSTSFSDQRVAVVTSQVISDLQQQLMRSDETDLATDLTHWQTTERSRLMDLTARYLGAEMSKEEQASDWSAPLSDEQLEYAAADAAVTLGVAGKIEVLCEALKVSKRVSWRIDKQRSELQTV